MKKYGKKSWNTPIIVELEVSKTYAQGAKKGNYENNTPSNDPHARPMS